MSFPWGSLLPNSISGHVQYILQAYRENMIPKYEWYKKSRLKMDSGDNLFNGKWIHKEKKRGESSLSYKWQCLLCLLLSISFMTLRSWTNHNDTCFLRVDPLTTYVYRVYQVHACRFLRNWPMHALTSPFFGGVFAFNLLLEANISSYFV